MTDPFRSAARAALSTAIVLVAMTWSGVARSDETINLDYDFYGNGIRVLTLGFDASVTDRAYKARYALKTKGLASLFSDGSTIAVAQGAIRRDTVAVRQFESESDNDKGKRVVTITWDERRNAKTVRSYDLGSRKSSSIRKALEPGIPDPVSAMLQATLFDAGKPCESAFTVYDGRHVFELRYAYQGRGTVSSDNGLYSGPAYKCTLTYKPVAGLSKSKMRKAREEPQPPFTIWLAPFKSPGLGQELLIPVRAEGRMKWANLEIYLRKGKVAGSPLTPTELARNQ
jgi:hypothetical protein